MFLVVRLVPFNSRSLHMSKNLRELRLVLRRMFVVFAVLGSLSVSATEYFVSKERPDDSGDGLTVESA